MPKYSSKPRLVGRYWFRAAEVPLADAHGLVLPGLEHVGHGGLVEIETAFVLGKEDARNADAGGVAAGDQGGAGWRADRVRGTEIR